MLPHAVAAGEPSFLSPSPLSRRSSSRQPRWTTHQPCSQLRAMDISLFVNFLDLEDFMSDERAPRLLVKYEGADYV